MRLQTERILDILRRHGARATFFVLGEIVDHDPWFARALMDAGHEVASHGYDHRLPASSLTPDAFRSDLRRSLDALGRAGVERVYGYRAPWWSLPRSRGDLLAVLRELGFAYDASLFPMRTYLYGDSSAPRFPFWTNAGLLEIPASTVDIFGRRVCLFGGFYLRAAHRLLIEAGIRRINRLGQPVVVYLHPREIDPGHPRQALGARNALIHYWNLRSAERKLEDLLTRFRFGACHDFLVSQP